MRVYLLTRFYISSCGRTALIRVILPQRPDLGKREIAKHHLRAHLVLTRQFCLGRTRSPGTEVSRKRIRDG